ncbi:hypothetical protein BMETH_796_2 [methanotrophic bacterial endosymbiont of Bathymodiolus sp.]|nr:hypothetical protein BMETH_796_2 [methanotrophic bacterial endosymbiont of Bathymodiolus sp.]
MTIKPKTHRAACQVRGSVISCLLANPVVSGLTASSLRNRYFSAKRIVSQAAKTIPPICRKKVSKSICAAEPIIRLGGSPTSVATPPVSDSNAAANR